MLFLFRRGPGVSLLFFTQIPGVTFIVAPWEKRRIILLVFLEGKRVSKSSDYFMNDLHTEAKKTLSMCFCESHLMNYEVLKAETLIEGED
jgi:hypothetical protein